MIHNIFGIILCLQVADTVPSGLLAHFCQHHVFLLIHDAYSVQPWTKGSEGAQQCGWIHFVTTQTTPNLFNINYQAHLQSVSLHHQLRIDHSQEQVEGLQWLQQLMLLKDYFTISDYLFLQFVRDRGSDKSFYSKLKLRCMVIPFLMLSGSVQPNPRPTISMHCFSTPSDLKVEEALVLYI